VLPAQAESHHGVSVRCQIGITGRKVTVDGHGGRRGRLSGDSRKREGHREVEQDIPPRTAATWCWHHPPRPHRDRKGSRRETRPAEAHWCPKRPATGCPRVSRRFIVGDGQTPRLRLDSKEPVSMTSNGESEATATLASVAPKSGPPDAVGARAARWDGSVLEHRPSLQPARAKIREECRAVAQT